MVRKHTNKGEINSNSWNEYFRESNEKDVQVNRMILRQMQECNSELKRTDKYYSFINSGEDTTKLYIYGDISSSDSSESYSIGSSTFQKQLESVKTRNLEVHINSYGGEVSEGLAIYHLLKDFKGSVTTINDGFACSIASVILMAGSKRVMKRSSLMLIHNAWTAGAGDANTLEKMADDLRKITNASVEIYKQVTKQKESVIKDLMDKETWLTPDEAYRLGFISEVSEESVQQSINQSNLYKMIMKMRSNEEGETKESEWNKFFNKR